MSSESPTGNPPDARGRPDRPVGSKTDSRAGSPQIAREGTVVIAEDHDDAREMLAMSLTVHGYTVFAARNGEEAFALVEAHRPKAVIADIQMPGVDGFELAAKIRATQPASIRLIALSGLPPRKAWSRAMECGFDYYLVKPVSADDLVAYIEGPLFPRDDEV